MRAMSWKGALLSGAVALGGCATVDDALRAANLANGVTTTTTTSSAPAEPAPAPAAEPTPAPEPAQSSGQWASPEALYGMFVMAFSNMGFAYGGAELKPGEYIRLGSDQEQTSEHRPAWFERARLKDDANGHQWWRVSFAGEQNESIVLEALYAPEQQKLLRLRAKLPGEAAPREFPVDTLQPVPPGRSVSPKQMGATDVGTESVTVPAGTFSAHHYQMAHAGDGIDWWIADAIPGGLVKMSGRSRGGGALQLQAYGTNATTQLGSF
jgi:hypothetical protein